MQPSNTPTLDRQSGPFTFRLATVFALMLLACIPLSWLAIRARQARTREAAEARINELGGRTVVLWPADMEPRRIQLDLAYTAVQDEDLKLLAQLPEIEILDLIQTDISDAGIDHLKEFPKLTIYCSGTRVTHEGVEKLRGSIRNLRVIMQGRPEE
jgi:hypothetical protein